MNDLGLQLLRSYCPHIHDLSIFLLEHDDNDAVCDLVAFYGPRLTRLAIRCNNPQTLDTIATHATRLGDLTMLRGHGRLCHPSSRWQQSTLTLLRRCGRLARLEMISWMVHDVPRLVWQVLARQKADMRQLYYLDDRALRQQRTIRHRDIGCLSKTLVLDTEELRELRKRL
ncbi:hypothetical protein BX666DRAFT_1900370 [Dichotomocladium elegans]|nr:hypothetical protein BX666DRAFT_1900370 [Dichotomocladium elegans]